MQGGVLGIERYERGHESRLGYDGVDRPGCPPCKIILVEMPSPQRNHEVAAVGKVGRQSIVGLTFDCFAASVGQIGPQANAIAVNAACFDQIARPLVAAQEKRVGQPHEAHRQTRGFLSDGSCTAAVKNRLHAQTLCEQCDACLTRRFDPGIEQKLAVAGRRGHGVVKDQPAAIHECARISRACARWRISGRARTPRNHIPPR